MALPIFDNFRSVLSVWKFVLFIEQRNPEICHSKWCSYWNLNLLCIVHTLIHSGVFTKSTCGRKNVILLLVSQLCEIMILIWSSRVRTWVVPDCSCVFQGETSGTWLPDKPCTSGCTPCHWRRPRGPGPAASCSWWGMVWASPPPRPPACSRDSGEPS